MKKCRECKKSIDVDASKCPYCQTNQRNWFFRHKILSFLLVMMFFPFVMIALPFYLVYWIINNKGFGQSEKKIYIGMIIGFILFMAFMLYRTDSIYHASKKTNSDAELVNNANFQNNQSSTSTPSVKQEFKNQTIDLNKVVSDFDILDTIKSGTTIRLIVLTNEKNPDNLIALNDYLFGLYGIDKTHVNIEYYDNKHIALNYWKLISNSALSDEEADDLMKHFIANMMYNKTTGVGEFNGTVNGELKRLKDY